MMHRAAGLLAIVVVVAACSSTDAEPTTTSVTATSSTTTAPATTTTTRSQVVDPLPSIPVGPGGIEYEGGAEDLELTGPDVLAVGPDGGVHIVNPATARIHSFWPDGTVTELDLVAADVLSAVFVAAASDHLVVVEIFFGPVRNQVHRIGYDGSVRSTFQLPIAGRLETGLSGVLVDGDDRIHLVLRGGEEFLRLDDATFAFTPSLTFTKHGVSVSGVGDVSIDGTVATADLVGELGGLRLVDIAEDGTVVLLREDVVSMSPITVVASVEWWSSAGFLGSAPLDLEAQAIDAPPGLAVAPSGVVIALYARADIVEVVRLDRSPERSTG